MKTFGTLQKTLILVLAAFIFATQITFAQDVDTVQVKVARAFLNHILKGEKESSWQLFDKANVPGVTRGQFDATADQLKNDLSLFDSFDLKMTGIKLLGDNQLNLYSFKAISTTKNVVDEILIDILFFKSSSLIAGLQPKKLLKENSASSSKGKETQIQGGFTAIIDSVSYQITGINIVHFANNDGILAIQVEYESIEEISSNPELAKKEGIKFAKYLIANGYLEKAKLKAKEIERTLLDGIGISFFNPGKAAGFNVIVEAVDYK